ALATLGDTPLCGRAPAALVLRRDRLDVSEDRALPCPEEFQVLIEDSLDLEGIGIAALRAEAASASTRRGILGRQRPVGAPIAGPDQRAGMPEHDMRRLVREYCAGRRHRRAALRINLAPDRVCQALPEPRASHLPPEPALQSFRPQPNARGVAARDRLF